MAIINEIDEIAKMLKLHRYKSELDFLNMPNDDSNDDKKKKKNKISTIIEIINDIDPDYKIETILRTKESNSFIKTKNMFSEMTKMVYMKPWKKLPEFHRIVKLKEYIEKNYGNDTDKYKNIESLLLGAIEKKELGRDDHVIYDTQNCEIISIPILKETNGAFKLEYSKLKK